MAYCFSVELSKKSPVKRCLSVNSSELFFGLFRVMGLGLGFALGLGLGLGLRLGLGLIQ